MATLYVKTPNGTQYSIDLTKVNSGGGSSSTNGYALLPNGCMIQWGTMAKQTSNSTVSVTFPTSFTSAAYAITLQNTGTGGYNDQKLNNSLSKTGFSTGNSNEYNTPLCYIVIGK